MNSELVMKTTEQKPANFRSWFMDKLLMGMTWPDYIRSLITPFNMVAALRMSAATILNGVIRLRM